MFLKHLTFSLALILSFCASAIAQTEETQEDPAKTEKEEAHKVLEQKALALLEETVMDAQSLKQATNRLRIQIIAADLIWSHDEARARVLFEKSIKDYADMVSSLDNSDPNYYALIQAPAQLFQEMLQTLVQHDARMALDFVRHTHPPQQLTQPSKYVEPNSELQMEMQIASQIVGKDPKLALQISMESLDKGLSSGIVFLVSQLQVKDHEGASRLANAIIKKLLAENLLLNNEAASVAINLLNNESRAQSHGSASNGKPLSAEPLIDDASYRDLMELVLNAALNSSTANNPSDWRERNIAQTLLMGLQNLMPQVERLASSRVGALQRKIADLRKGIDAGSRVWQDYQEVFQKGSVDDILAISSKVPPESRDQIYQQAAWKAMGQGEVERARQIISDNISNPMERRRMLDEIERQTATKAASEGKLDQARQALSRLHTNEERATALTQLAAAIAGRDKAGAIRLLEEARSLVSSKAENYNQLQVQLQIARSFAPLDPAQSFEILETIIAQFNDLLSAAEVLNGFEQQYYKDGELVWQTTMLSNLLGQVVNDLGQLAPTNFDRTREIAGRLQRPEVRIMAQLSIARMVLSDQPQRNFQPGKRRIMSVSGGVSVQEF